MRHAWRDHPTGVGDNRTFGEVAADDMRNGLGTWTFILLFLAALVLWIATAGFGTDLSPYFRLNLALSCLAGLQGAIILIAQKRADRVASDLARHHYEVSRRNEEAIRHVVEHSTAPPSADVQAIKAQMATDLAHHHDRLIGDMRRLLAGSEQRLIGGIMGAPDVES